MLKLKIQTCLLRFFQLLHNESAKQKGEFDVITIFGQLCFHVLNILLWTDSNRSYLFLFVFRICSKAFNSIFANDFIQFIKAKA